MSEPILVQVIGAPIACKDGIKDTWRDVASWAAGQLHQRFGEMVQVQYFDLFDPVCPSVPSGMTLPVVMVNHGVVSNGVKISVPVLCRLIEKII